MSDFKPLFTWRSAVVESDLPPTTRHVALTLSLHMNERGGSCYPSAKTLARETGLGVSTVREHRAYLELAGWIRCVERGGLKGEHRRASAYEASFPDPSSSRTHPGAVPVQETALTPPANRADPSSSRTPVLQEFSKRSSLAKRRKKKPAIPLPADWVPSDATKEWARREYPQFANRRELAAFRDHAEQNDRRVVNWDAALRNWIRNAAKYAAQREKSGPARTFL